MIATTTRSFLLLAGITGLCSCLNIEPLPEVTVDGTGGGGGMTSQPLLGDQCSGDVPVGQPGMEPQMGMTVGLTDSVRDLGSCGLGSDMSGPDGFFTVDVLAGERWHMMVRPAPEEEDMDVTAFVLSSCDERDCARGQEQCGPGAAEHINFLAETSGTHVFGVESSKPGAVMVMLMKPPCGNGEKQHGETCDDGNLETGDGCTPTCQAELLAEDVAEVEPNNEALEANIVRLATATGEVRIKGTTGGKCDVDRFVVDVPEGGSLHATMLFANAVPCGAEGEGSWLRLYELEDHPGELTTIGEGISGRAGGECPSIEAGDSFAEDLPGGSYSLTIGSPHESEQFDYELHVTIMEPPASQ